MYRYLFIVIILLITDIISFHYLKMIDAQRTAFRYVPSSKILIYQKKEVLIDDPSDFDFNVYFSLLGFKDAAYRYELRDGNVVIEIDRMNHVFPYKIREPVIESIEKIIYKERTDEKISSLKQEQKYDHHPVNEEEQYEEEYFHLRREKMSFESGTDLSQIIEMIIDQVDTNMKVTVDYSELNPNQIGQYTVYFITNTGKYAFLIEID